MWAAILDGLLALLKAIPILSKWFTQTATEKADAAQAEVQKRMDAENRTGRPQ